MLAGLSLAIALLAEVAVPPANAAAADPVPAAAAASAPAYGPALPAPAKPPEPKQAPKTVETAVKAGDRCASTRPSPDADEIVVCAERPQGYRLDPDVMAAKRGMRHRRLKPPENMKDNSCASVGPAGCVGRPTIDYIQTAIVLGTMIAKAAKGENVGKMFITDPQPDEYQLYVEAKRRREAEEAEAAAAVKAKGAKADAGKAEVDKR